MEDGGRWRPRNALAQAGPDVVHVARLLVEVELVDDAFLQLLKEGRAAHNTAVKRHRPRPREKQQFSLTLIALNTSNFNSVRCKNSARKRKFFKSPTIRRSALGYCTFTAHFSPVAFQRPTCTWRV